MLQQVDNPFEKTKSKDVNTENEGPHFECIICKMRFPSKNRVESTCFKLW